MKTFLKIMAVVFLTSLFGCAHTGSVLSGDTVSVRTKVPEIPEVERPQLEAFTPEDLAEYNKLSAPLRAKLEGNMNKVKEYADEERAQIHDYDAFAKTNNALSDQENGVKAIRRIKP